MVCAQNVYHPLITIWPEILLSLSVNANPHSLIGPQFIVAWLYHALASAFTNRLDVVDKEEEACATLDHFGTMTRVKGEWRSGSSEYSWRYTWDVNKWPKLWKFVGEISTQVKMLPQCWEHLFGPEKHNNRPDCSENGGEAPKFGKGEVGFRVGKKRRKGFWLNICDPLGRSSLTAPARPLE